MPSPAALMYDRESNKAQILYQTATDKRLRPMSRIQTQVYYHAILRLTTA